MKEFAEFPCVLSICMCLLRFQCIELSGPPYRTLGVGSNFQCLLCQLGCVVLKCFVRVLKSENSLNMSLTLMCKCVILAHWVKAFSFTINCRPALIITLLPLYLHSFSFYCPCLWRFDKYHSHPEYSFMA